MPTRTLEIKEGPNYKLFVIENGIVGSMQWDLTFTMDQEVPNEPDITQAEPRKFVMTMKMFGQAPGRNPDNYTFIGHRRRPDASWFYVGTYNTTTRTGTCEEFTRAEFSTNYLTRLMFPDLV